MNLNDIFQQMRNGAQDDYTYKSLPIEKLDLFIDKCKEKEDMNLFMLGNELHKQLETNTVQSIEWRAIIPHVLHRITTRLQQGEQ